MTKKTNLNVQNAQINQEQEQVQAQKNLFKPSSETALAVSRAIGNVKTIDALKASLEIVSKEESIKQLPLFEKVNRAIENSILINRVLSIDSLINLRDLDIRIAHAILNMSNTQQLTFEQLKEKIDPTQSYLTKKDTQENSKTFYKLSHIVKDQDIIKMVMLISALTNKITLVLNKNNVLSIKCLESDKTSLLQASFYYNTVKVSKNGTEKKKRTTVKFKEEFKDLLIGCLYFAKDRESYKLALHDVSNKQYKLEK